MRPRSRWMSEGVIMPTRSFRELHMQRQRPGCPR
jgi:hypothetical protein